MGESEKVVLRFNDGKVLKGHIENFSETSSEVIFEDSDGKGILSVSLDKLKAIFFVKSFEGDSKYIEKKKYGIRQTEGRKIYIKFADGESLVGYVKGDTPWGKGFFISKPDEKLKGFFLIPTDTDSNNIRTFVVRSSVKDITALP
ncbi:MAG: hypothetical protein LLF28_07745 [Nitrospiraceae bacterium]|nr:hypothetical protein [Nitrospiraceae bacterium]